ncbi:MAG: hypothetical protein WC614_09550 [bacterium]
MNLQDKTIKQLRYLINDGTENRSGKDLVEFFNSLGFDDHYGYRFPTRDAYTERKLNQINKTPKMEECIKQLFSPVPVIVKNKDLNKHIVDFNQYLAVDGYKIVLDGKTVKIISTEEEVIIPVDSIAESEFINRKFKDVSLEKLGLDNAITDILKQRIQEIVNCLRTNSHLATIFLCGSTLEGILLSIAIKNREEFTESLSSPKNPTGKPRPVYEWSLSNLIDVAHSLDLIDEDVKKFSYVLRDFRNYIHPHLQMSSGFNPNEHTAKICWQVLQASIYQLSRKK